MDYAPAERLIKTWSYASYNECNELMECTLTVTNKRVISAQYSKHTSKTQEISTSNVCALETYTERDPDVKKKISGIIISAVFGLIFLLLPLVDRFVYGLFAIAQKFVPFAPWMAHTLCAVVALICVLVIWGKLSAPLPITGCLLNISIHTTIPSYPSIELSKSSLKRQRIKSTKKAKSKKQEKVIQIKDVKVDKYVAAEIAETLGSVLLGSKY